MSQTKDKKNTPEGAKNFSQEAREFAPFENSTQQVEVGPGNGLTFENLDENIAVYGDMEIRPTDSIEKVQKLIDNFTKIRDTMILMQQNNFTRPKKK